MHSFMSTENPSLLVLCIENDVFCFFSGFLAIRFICMVNTYCR